MACLFLKQIAISVVELESVTDVKASLITGPFSLKAEWWTLEGVDYCGLKGVLAIEKVRKLFFFFLLALVIVKNCSRFWHLGISNISGFSTKPW